MLFWIASCDSKKKTDGGDTDTTGETGGDDEVDDDVVGGETTIKYIRYAAHTPEGQANMAAMRTALAKMRELPCTDNRSWYYQGGMHWVPDEINGTNKLCAEYQNSGDAMLGWRNCTHAEGSEIHFLLWHRLYIYYFEKIVRDLSETPTFALPYWDYCDENYRVMPADFRDTESSLYTASRLISLNAGDPIGPEMDNFLNVTNLFENKDYKVFNQNIDRAPHGMMHVYIGSGLGGQQSYNEIYQAEMTGLMTNVPSAAFDPIFWVHHGNIDFLWEDWERTPNGARPTLAELEASPWPYLFFNERGEEVRLTIAEAYEMGFNMDYTYDVFANDKKVLASEDGTPQADGSSEMAAEDAPQMQMSEDGIALQTQDETKKLAKSAIGTKVNKASTSLSASFTIDQPALKRNAVENAVRKVTILKVVVGFENEPIGGYEVYVKAKSDDSEIVAEEKLAGLMTFFGASHHASHHGHGDSHDHGDHDAAAPEFEFDFDISHEIDVENFDGEMDIEIVRLGGDDDELTVLRVELEQREIK